MALMTWDNSFSTGVQAMDDQHKGLVSALNELHSAMSTGTSNAVLGKLLTALVKYTQDHFAAEEALMVRTQYAKLAGHRARHKDLIGQVERFEQRYRRGEIAISLDLLVFLREWLVTHIQKEDRDYGPWLNQNGIR